MVFSSSIPSATTRYHFWATKLGNLRCQLSLAQITVIGMELETDADCSQNAFV